MTQGEIEDYVRSVLELYWKQDQYFVSSAVAQITDRWSQEQDDAHQRGVWAGQESCGDWQD